MANEISISISVSFSKDNVTYSKTSSAFANKSTGTYQADLRDIDVSGGQLDNGYSLTDGHSLLLINHGDYTVTLGRGLKTEPFGEITTSDGMAWFHVATGGTPPYAWTASSGQVSELEVIVVPD